jgi:hypothetical protein
LASSSSRWETARRTWQGSPPSGHGGSGTLFH